MTTFEDIIKNPDILKREDVILYMVPRNMSHVPRVERAKITELIDRKQSFEGNWHITLSLAFLDEDGDPDYEDGFDEVGIFYYPDQDRAIDEFSDEFNSADMFLDFNKMVKHVDERKNYWDKVHNETHAAIAKFF